MRLLLDIDDQLFNQVMKLTKAKKKRDAVIIPMKEYLQARQRNEIANLIGNFELQSSLKDLLKSRKKWINS